MLALAFVLGWTGLGWLLAFRYTRRVKVRRALGTRYEIAIAETLVVRLAGLVVGTVGVAELLSAVGGVR